MKVQPITSINYDENTQFAVTDLPDNIKELVEYYNDWRERQADARSQYVMTQAAIRDVTKEIGTAMKQWIESQAQPTEAAPQGATLEITEQP